MRSNTRSASTCFKEAAPKGADPLSFLRAETALATSPLFLSRELSLLCSVLVNGGQFADYLVVAGSTPVLAIRLTDTGRDRVSKNGIPVLQYARNRMRSGAVDGVLTALEACLRDLRSVPEAAPFAQMVPSQLHAKMAELRMIQQCEGSRLWVPSAYGTSLGLVRGVVPLNSQRACHGFFLMQPTLEKLMDSLSWAKRTRDLCRTWQAPLSWDFRMDRLRQGLPANDLYAYQLVRDFADMPLSTYFSKHENLLEKTSSLLGVDPDRCSYLEAAARIYRLCQDPQAAETGKDLVSYLMTPFRDIWKSLGYSANS